MENYLVHHGIKGQKWGVRRTPEELGREDRKARAVAAASSESRYRELRDYRKREGANDILYDELINKKAAKNYRFGLSKSEIKEGQKTYEDLKAHNQNKELSDIMGQAWESLSFEPGSAERNRLMHLTATVESHTNKKGQVKGVGITASSERERMKLNSRLNRTHTDRFGQDWDIEDEYTKIRNKQEGRGGRY